MGDGWKLMLVFGTDLHDPIFHLNRFHPKQDPTKTVTHFQLSASGKIVRI